MPETRTIIALLFLLWCMARAIALLPVMPLLSFWLDYYAGLLHFVGAALIILHVFLIRSVFFRLAALSAFALSIFAWHPLPERATGGSPSVSFTMRPACELPQAQSGQAEEAHLLLCKASEGLAQPAEPHTLLRVLPCPGERLLIAHGMLVLEQVSLENFCAIAAEQADGGTIVVFMHDETRFSRMVRQTDFWRELRRFANLLRHSESDASEFYFVSTEPLASVNLHMIATIARLGLRVEDASAKAAAAELLWPVPRPELRVLHFVRAEDDTI